ncbi:MAG: aminocarboxymuconate-semialdehyde decarboxylase [Firmicutes bacterium]|nr:aminocarboxymuconate-semialdehyde decarboxylase [Bacillota bacterium]
MIIDAHAHLVPPYFLDELRGGKSRWGAQLEERNGQLWVRHDQGFAYPCPPTFYDPASMFGAMDQQGIDQRVLSIAPPIFYYWADRQTCADLAREYNQSAAALARAYPDRLAAMAHVPLPHVQDAIAELERAIALGLKGCEIGTTIEGVSLDHPEFRPFLQRAADLGVPLFLHPYYNGPKPGMDRFYFTNSVGNPLDTHLAAAALIHGGVLAELPHLKLMLAHGGGFFPYQRARLEHAWAVRQEPRVKIAQPPSAYLGCFYYDTITFNPLALRYLIDQEGSERVMLGSDFAFDMGPVNPVNDVRLAGLSEPVRNAVLGENARRLLGL